MRKFKILLSLSFKPLLFLVILITTSTLKAQNYMPMAIDSSYWILSDNDNCSNISFQTDENITQYYLYGDTVISSIAYKKVSRRTGYKSACFDTVTSYSPFVLYAALRDDTLNKKVYAILFQNQNGTPCPTNQEFMLYDFDLQVGDSIKTNDWCVLGQNEEISSIGNYSIFSIPNVKHFFIGTNVLYEGIGSNLGLFELIFISVSGLQQGLIDYCREGCDLTTSISEKNKLREQVSVYPNPSYAIFNIAVPTLKDEVQVTIYNLSGQQIKTLFIKDQGIIDLSKQPNGIYFVKVIHQHQVITKKIIKY